MTSSRTRTWDRLLRWVDLTSKIAAIVAVIIAGIWTYYLSNLTGETDINPELWVHTRVLPYSHNTRLLIVNVREQNIGKVPVELGPEALTVTLRKVPDTLPPGSIDMDKQPITYQRTGIFKRYGAGLYLEAGMQLEDAVEFIVAPGLYQAEADLALPDGDMVNDMTIQQVQ